MNHPILSDTEFAEHFRLKAQDWGYQACEFLKLDPLIGRHWPLCVAAFGVVIRGQVLITTNRLKKKLCCGQEFQIQEAQGLRLTASSQGSEVFIARLEPMIHIEPYSASAGLNRTWAAGSFTESSQCT